MNANSIVLDNIADVANGGKKWDHTNPDKPFLMKFSDEEGEKVITHDVSGTTVGNNLFGKDEIDGKVVIRLISLLTLFRQC